MTHPLSSPTLLLLAGVLLGSCTDSGSPTETGNGNDTASIATVVRTPGTRADSLGGIPGHKFGEPLNAFPGLELTANQKPGTQTYHYPGGKGEPGWFGKRKQESPNEFYSFYTFKDGRFVAFQAMALGTGRKALQEQTRYLLGAGTPTTTTTNWEGEQVLAYYSLTTQPGSGLAEVLDLQSQDFVKGRATARAALLKAENTQ
ncbi:MAG TPA: hypothetical protein VF598_08445 [Hymenobacter sp.]